jgi:hypothetical protein
MSGRVLLTAAAALAALTLAGCFGDDPLPAVTKPAVLRGELAIDIRETARLVITSDGADAQVEVTLTKGYGVAPVGAALVGNGHAEAFPEAGMGLLTARFDAPADLTGPCGAQPVSLALSLHRRGKDAHVGGSLTAYCGQGVWHGVPARLLRLSGDLPLP